VEIALALVRRDGRLLIARRPAGVHLAGLWEFPGGKMRPGETPAAAAEREAREETGVECRARAALPVIEHAYGERRVRLHPVECAWLAGEPQPLGAAECRWVRPEDLGAYEFPAANAGLLVRLASGL